DAVVEHVEEDRHNFTRMMGLYVTVPHHAYARSIRRVRHCVHSTGKRDVPSGAHVSRSHGIRSSLRLFRSLLPGPAGIGTGAYIAALLWREFECVSIGH